MLTRVVAFLLSSVLLFSCASGTPEAPGTDSVIQDGVKIEAMDSPSHNMPIAPVDTTKTDMPTVDLKTDSIQPK
jgi:hypothetical protein